MELSKSIRYRYYVHTVKNDTVSIAGRARTNENEANHLSAAEQLKCLTINREDLFQKDSIAFC